MQFLALPTVNWSRRVASDILLEWRNPVALVDKILQRQVPNTRDKGNERVFYDSPSFRSAGNEPADVWGLLDSAPTWTPRTQQGGTNGPGYATEVSVKVNITFTLLCKDLAWYISLIPQLSRFWGVMVGSRAIDGRLRDASDIRGCRCAWVARRSTARDISAEYRRGRYIILQ